MKQEIEIPYGGMDFTRSVTVNHLIDNECSRMRHSVQERKPYKLQGLTLPITNSMLMHFKPRWVVQIVPQFFGSSIKDIWQVNI